MNYMHLIRHLQGHFMSPLTFAMSTSSRNSLRHSATSFLDNFFWRPSCLCPTATRITYLCVTTSFLSFNSKHDFRYVYSEVYHAQTTSHFNSTYLFWRRLFPTPKSTTGNTPNACSTLLYFFSSSLRRPAQRLTLNSTFIKLLKLK